MGSRQGARRTAWHVLEMMACELQYVYVHVRSSN
jgi:hypothetical protein